MTKSHSHYKISRFSVAGDGIGRIHWYWKHRRWTGDWPIQDQIHVGVCWPLWLRIQRIRRVTTNALEIT